MDKAIYGLVGVALGVFLGVLKDWIFQKAKRKKEYEYLAIGLHVSLIALFIVALTWYTMMVLRMVNMTKTDVLALE